MRVVAYLHTWRPEAWAGSGARWAQVTEAAAGGACGSVARQAGGDSPEPPSGRGEGGQSRELRSPLAESWRGWVWRRAGLEVEAVPGPLRPQSRPSPPELGGVCWSLACLPLPWLHPRPRACAPDSECACSKNHTLTAARPARLPQWEETGCGPV